MHTSVPLRIVATLFILAGAAAVVNIAVGLVDQRVVLDLNVLGLWVGPGLLRGENRARRVAQLLVLVTGFGACLLLVMASLHPPGLGEVRVLGRVVGSASPFALILVALALLSLSGWLWRVLARTEFTSHVRVQA